ncbi:MAG: hypothetical protein JSS30_02790 [Verrucomicrobia bacterium]|nr:hypothetical protein [Verrucomicrobiota bacterium]
MKKYNGYALVTGGDIGIDYAIAEQLATNGYIPKQPEESVFGCDGILDFESACIAQPIQVELLRRRCADSNSRRRLCQKPILQVVSV